MRTTTRPPAFLAVAFAMAISVVGCAPAPSDPPPNQACLATGTCSPQGQDAGTTPTPDLLSSAPPSDSSALSSPDLASHAPMPPGADKLLSGDWSNCASGAQTGLATNCVPDKDALWCSTFSCWWEDVDKNMSHDAFHCKQVTAGPASVDCKRQ